MKKFNTTAVCIPEKHYMVDLTERCVEIKKMIDAGKYFTINRARQYGKTTTLFALESFLAADYDVLSLDFQKLTATNFSTEEKFVQAFGRQVIKKKNKVDLPDDIVDALQEIVGRKEHLAAMDELFDVIDDWCKASEKPIVMMIDEVDSATNNQVFLDFLAQLRGDYIEREKYPNEKTFQSVILAGVTDVKHLKSKIRSEEESKENSPWNIAADFDVDMSLSEDGIRGMLDEYESDHHAGMDTAEMARQVWEYTNGYPFLVSRICELIDTTVTKRFGDEESAWSRLGLDEAIKLLLAEDNTLFQTLTKNLNNYPKLKTALQKILMEGEKVVYSADQSDIVQMEMYGFIRNEKNAVRISNRIFETRLYNLFLSDEDLKSNAFSKAGGLESNIFVEGGQLNVRRILERFIATYHEVCGPLGDKFKEKDGRELFLLYLKPIINGTGNYYIEAQTRDQKRTDVVIDYLGKQYIIELKIWRGERYNAEGEKQISEYLDYYHLDMGYMLSFNFNKNKEPGIQTVQVDNKTLIEAVV